MASDSAYRDTQKNSHKQNAGIEYNKALGRFKRWISDTVFGLTNEEGRK